MNTRHLGLLGRTADPCWCNSTDLAVPDPATVLYGSVTAVSGDYAEYPFPGLPASCILPYFQALVRPPGSLQFSTNVARVQAY